MGNFKGRRVSARHAEGRQRRRKERGKKGRRRASPGIRIQKGEEIQKAHREAGGKKREEKKAERLCDSGAAEQQVTERRKSRFELIFVEEVNTIVQSTLFKHSAPCRGAGQVTERHRET